MKKLQVVGSQPSTIYSRKRIHEGTSSSGLSNQQEEVSKEICHEETSDSRLG
jgi:hypothetical protein